MASRRKTAPLERWVIVNGRGGRGAVRERYTTAEAVRRDGEAQPGLYVRLKALVRADR